MKAPPTSEVLFNAFVGNKAVGLDIYEPNGGGGLCSAYTDPLIAANLIARNTSNRYGAGAMLNAGSVRFDTNAVTDNILTGTTSQGAGVYVSGQNGAYFFYNTLARNTGGDGAGLTLGDDPWGNYADAYCRNNLITSQTIGVNIDSGDAYLVGNMWGAGEWANGMNFQGTPNEDTDNFSGNPDYIAPHIGDYHIGENFRRDRKGGAAGGWVNGSASVRH